MTMAVANDNDDDEQVSLWEREESPLLTLCISKGLELTLRQYPSHDDRWGIHSCVWDGGIATLAYFQHQQQQQQQQQQDDDVLVRDNSNQQQQKYQQQQENQVLVLDLGSGTGIVGLGLAQLRPLWLRRVYLTDLPEAMSLLQENIHLNTIVTSPITADDGPLVQAAVLNWQEITDALQDENHFLTKELLGRQDGDALDQPLQQHVLLVGADIIYRPTLFQPLLETMHCIRKMILSSSSSSSSTCSFRVLLGCHSIRTHLHEFWRQARTMGFHVRYKASVRVEMNTTTTATTIETLSETTVPATSQSNVGADHQCISSTTTAASSSSNAVKVVCPSFQISFPSEDVSPEDAPVDPALTTIVELY